MKQFAYSSEDTISNILIEFYSWRNRHQLESDAEISILNTETNETFTNTVYNQVQELKEALLEE